MIKITKEEIIDKYFKELNLEFNDSLTDFTNHSFNIITNNEMLSLEKDSLISRLYSKIHNAIYNDIIRSFTSIGSILDLTNTTYSNKLIGFINLINQNNLIVTDYSYTHFLLSKIKNKEIIPTINYTDRQILHKCELIDNKNLYLDYNFYDSTIFSYDKIYINLIIYPVLSSDTFCYNNTEKVLHLDFKVNIKVINAKINYLLTDNTNDLLRKQIENHLLKENRIETINKIINH